MSLPDEAPARDRLLRATQDILVEKGLEQLNTNVIARRAGVTPPTLYHYFANKHAILGELAQQLMHAQTEVIRVDTGIRVRTRDDLREAVARSIAQGLAVTRSFPAGYQLLVCMRAVPALAHIRRDSHRAMASLVADYFIEQGLARTRDDLRVRCLLAQDLKYAAIEMLFETDFADTSAVLMHAADAVTEVYALF
ncbi:hypothetical protein ASE75_02920 [Sphingomonas sp. Leaf17]|uniref:TetR/AcrR family transcriptional regulator n=1 Tax=Sphingomonas sp. Leaf17 TaxID=1735683 RepID=UPI0006FDE4E5|nr:TetR/AcrR family transcriptional regulator [Sphingomonas sp. Leaf17]KQM67854.1 hypothetical protein ASE75_02920 [Sphingomonas sp. Leaf17]